MKTSDTIHGYFDSLKKKGAWADFLAEDLQFTSFTTPIKHVTGKRAYLEATKRFFSMISAVDIKSVLVDGDRACVLTRYELRPPAGPGFESHVAEAFEVRGGKITALDIYFDSAPFPK